MNTDSTNLDIVNNEAEERFQTELEGRLAFVQYNKTAGQIVFTHTEVPKELEGRGLGSKMAKVALEYARSQEVKVIAQCPFIASYIERHKEYESLLD